MKPCTPWSGYIGRDGYGRVMHDGRRGALAHRVAYETVLGPVPDGLELDHLCRNRACVNIEHLEPVTHAENMRRARLATCRRGLHALTPDNSYPSDRRCKTCAQERQNARRRAARSAA